MVRWEAAAAHAELCDDTRCRDLRLLLRRRGRDLLLELAGNDKLYDRGGADRLLESADPGYPADSDELRGVRAKMGSMPSTAKPGTFNRLMCSQKAISNMMHK
jgi:hypothetical protein